MKCIRPSSDLLNRVLRAASDGFSSSGSRAISASAITDFELFSMEEIGTRRFEDWAAALINPGDWPASQQRQVDFACLTSDGLLERLALIRRYGVVAARALPDAA